MKTLLIIIGIIVLVIVVAVITNYSIESNKEEIVEWAKENNMEVKSIEPHFTTIDTPFYYLGKGCYIFEVDMTNGEKWWVRTGLFSNDYEKQNN
jgi:uncharacterized protein YpmB